MGLKLHRIKTFKLSRDPDFVAKLEDVVGLYLNPSDKALALCRSKRTMMHDYKRNGTTTVFAALNIMDGTVIGR